MAPNEYSPLLQHWRDTIQTQGLLRQQAASGIFGVNPGLYFDTFFRPQEENPPDPVLLLLNDEET